jgi:hypothetical protein
LNDVGAADDSKLAVSAILALRFTLEQVGIPLLEQVGDIIVDNAVPATLGLVNEEEVREKVVAKLRDLISTGYIFGAPSIAPTLIESITLLQEGGINTGFSVVWSEEITQVARQLLGTAFAS